MASPLITALERAEIIRNMQVTVSPVEFVFRGDWKPGTSYNKNDYVYAPGYPGFLYVATTAGTSQSEHEGITGELEPLWSMFSPAIYDGALQFVPKEVDEETAYKAKRWKPGIKVKRGEYLAPSNGPGIIYGQEKQYYIYQLNKCVTSLDWPRTPREYIKDNNITWECRVSYGKLLPAARLIEPMYVELVEVMDFLNLHEELFFDDLTYKYADQMRIRNVSIKEVMAEFGYNYITDFIGLTDKELQTALTYVSLIHYLKGSEAGLSLVFELLGVTARWEEWWEANPPGIPDTWKLWVDMDVAKASGYLSEKIINFTRQYVYPIMQEFEVTYKVGLINLAIAMAGFFNAEYKFSLTPGLMLMQGVGTYIDRDYEFSLKARVESVIGKETQFLGTVFGFRSIYGNIGTWGNIWIKYDYNQSNRVPYAGVPSDEKLLPPPIESTQITPEEAMVLLSADPKREDE